VLAGILYNQDRDFAIIAAEKDGKKPKEFINGIFAKNRGSVRSTVKLKKTPLTVSKRAFFGAFLRGWYKYANLPISQVKCITDGLKKSEINLIFLLTGVNEML